MKNSSVSLLAVGLTLLTLVFNGCGQPSNTNDKANAPQVVASNVNSAAPSDVAATSAAPSPSPNTPGDSTVGTFKPPSAAERAQEKPAPSPPPTAPAKAGPLPKPQIGSGGNDFYLFTQARGAINADSELQNAGIVVDVRGGVATLTGIVPDEARKQKAAHLLQGVSGITSIKNQLRVAAKR
jgi:hyperosmotically inducible protein